MVSTLILHGTQHLAWYTASERPPASQYEIQKFDWTVQSYRFDTSKSPIFFFWARAGDEGLFSSHYFNITDGGPSTSLAALPEITSTSSLPVQTSWPAHASPLPSSSTIGISSAESTPSISSTRLASATVVSSIPSHTLEPSRESDHALDTVGKVGIGLGAGMFLIITILCLIFGYRFAQRRAVEAQNKQLPPYPPPSYARSQGLAISDPSSEWGKTPTHSARRYICELGSSEPKELSARRTIVEMPAFHTPRSK